MAKPLNPYQGPAPAAMSQMGQGFLEAGANIGRSLQSGYESMGKGLAAGITSAASSIALMHKQQQDMKSQVKAAEKSYETLKGYLPPEVQQKFDDQIKLLNTSDTTSLRDKAAFWDQAKGFIGSSVAQTMALQKQQQEQAAAMARTMAGEAGATGRQTTALQSQFDLEQLRQKYKAQQGAGGVNFGLEPFGGGGSSGASSYNQMFGE
jgi:hypothetical protein